MGVAQGLSGEGGAEEREAAEGRGGGRPDGVEDGAERLAEGKVALLHSASGVRPSEKRQ